MTTPRKTPTSKTKNGETSRKSAQKRNIPEHFHSNREAVEMTIEILFGLGRLEKIDAATVTMARLLATAVDENPASHGLWKQYGQAVAQLRGIGDSDDQDFAAYMEQLDAALRDTPPNQP